jgi:acetyl-CoA synthetase
MKKTAYPPSFYNRKPILERVEFESLYNLSQQNPNEFWQGQIHNLHWFTKPTKASSYSFTKNNLHIKWFEDGILNASYNAIDRHLPHKANKTAIIWEGDDPKNSTKITYSQLLEKVCKFANTLKEISVKKGDRVVIYLPMILEAAYAVLACSRIGAIFSVVFAGFSPQALKDRIEDLDASLIITANFNFRGGKKINLKQNVDEALNLIENKNLVKNVLVVENGETFKVSNEKELNYNILSKKVKPFCEAEKMGAEDGLFILYTSGSTGKPKGVFHTTAGYLLYTLLTHKFAFAYKEDEIFFCTADIGWITGHSYVVFGPLLNGGTTVMFEGVPSYPTYSRFWEIVDKHEVDILYTAPTAIRQLMKMGDDFVKSTSRKSLKVLGSVGEPINPEAWHWYHSVVGNEKCPIIDTWWQTETGGFIITPIAGISSLKPGIAGKPFFGINTCLIDSEGSEVKDVGYGNLCIKNSWPGQMRGVYKNESKFFDTYFSNFPNKFFSGDGAHIDEGGDFQITGRVDDIIKVSGHKIGTAEVENAIILNTKVAESACVGFPHSIKGQGICVFVILKQGISESDTLKNELILLVSKEISPIAKPDKIFFTPDLPKTRSGKIMRRILRKIMEGETKDFGDIRTLSNPQIVEKIVQIVSL